MADQAPGDALSWRPESYRPYLLLLASAWLDDRLRGKVEPADLVQQALVRACQAHDQFQGDASRRAAWLRSILSNVMIDAARKYFGKGGVERERSLEAALEQSSARLEEFLADDGTSPSQKFERDERLRRLADAMARLPEDQRRAIDLKHLQGKTVHETAAAMGKTTAAVAGLLRRGLHTLREDLGDC
jgi:RNA polymerase sigma-70 factor (ECF subfamily)